MFYDLGAIAARLKPFNAPAADVAAVSVFEENAVFGASRFLVIRQTAGYPPPSVFPGQINLAAFLVLA